MKTLSVARQALGSFAHPCTTLGQTECYGGAQPYKQNSAATPKSSFFLCIHRKGKLGALEQAQQKISLLKRRTWMCKKKTNSSAEAIQLPAVFHRDRAPMRCPLIQPGVHFLWTRESIKCPCGPWTQENKTGRLNHLESLLPLNLLLEFATLPAKEQPSSTKIGSL